MTGTVDAAILALVAVAALAALAALVVAGACTAASASFRKPSPATRGPPRALLNDLRSGLADSADRIASRQSEEGDACGAP